jgi:hypothetical protein
MSHSLFYRRAQQVWSGPSILRFGVQALAKKKAARMFGESAPMRWSLPWVFGTL